jgi:acyl transferase domain-containing protein
MSLNDMTSQDQAPEPIAMVGSFCRFPNGVSSPSELRDPLRQPWDVLSKTPQSLFNTGKFYNPDAKHSGTVNDRLFQSAS